MSEQMSNLAHVTVADLMRRQVTTLPVNAPIKEAIATLEDEHISGAPVVDLSGKPVGFLTTHDVTRTEHMSGSRLEERTGDDDMSMSDEDDNDDGFPSREDYSTATLGHATVADWMSPGIQFIAPDADLGTLCRLLDEESVHRVLVQEGDRMVGIVSSMDVVRHLAHAL